MKKYLFFSWLSVIVGVTACAKSEPEPTRPVDPPVGSETHRLVKITSGEQNQQSYQYNDQGLLQRSNVHWRYNDSLTVASTTTFTYDTEKRLSRILYDGKPYVTFFYEGKLLDKTEEYDHKGRLVVTHFYLFNGEGQLVELLDQIHDTETAAVQSFIKHRYEYEGQRNVQRVLSFRKNVNDPTFTPWQNVYYEHYDTKKNPHLPQVSYPFVEVTATQVNNPGKVTVRDARDESLLSVEIYAYTYGAQGYPLKKTQQLSTTHPLPAVTVSYQYQ
ncbi:hypothetical protein BWI97_25250 [Siphonobacter sp. BAB-5405]|uniref:hypothetical protein n=1 Tax=Siphonobacter sp. BAB-5405 TaxID=1864825 RepID=UPI000C810363|nr:hypothetical protein [Siphonobacter sp. BAB-5405]PMD88624.1 hypothetical protein BWI97_25250 [Siphonobacter sp. BAB-5405]